MTVDGLADGGLADGGLAGRLVAFVAALREHGLPVGPAETVDAAQAITVLGVAEREQLRHGMAATLMRAEGGRAVFDAVFDLYFPAAVGVRSSTHSTMDDVTNLRAQLADALAASDDERLAELAAQAVEQFGRVGGGNQPGSGGSGSGGSGSVGSGSVGSAGPPGWSALRTLERLQAQTLIAGVSERVSQGDEQFTTRLDRDEVRRRVEAFREMVRSEARRRSAEVREREQVARHAATSVTDLDFLAANRNQLAELRRTVQPMSRRLASRLSARRRRSRRGVIDVRRTFRRSLSTGGVPVVPVYRRRRPGRPEIVLLCDVSGSVAGFANFTLMLVEALHDQFSRVRAFAFVDSVDEVTELVADNDADPAGLARRILAETRVSSYGGHSDYGNALGEFADVYLEAVGPRTSVLILGDARNNGGNPNLRALAEILGRARGGYWLNPEPRRSWGTGDSLALTYREHIEMHECRSARQLGDVISRLLPV